jgi:CCR4-NOT complex subunit CAF16
MRLGSFVTDPTLWPLSTADDVGTPDRTLFRTALQWLREDREHRRELEKGGRKIRGARRDQVRIACLRDHLGLCGQLNGAA